MALYSLNTDISLGIEKSEISNSRKAHTRWILLLVNFCQSFTVLVRFVILSKQAMSYYKILKIIKECQLFQLKLCIFDYLEPSSTYYTVYHTRCVMKEK